jgi:hypothetical protein
MLSAGRLEKQKTPVGLIGSAEVVQRRAPQIQRDYTDVPSDQQSPLDSKAGHKKRTQEVRAINRTVSEWHKVNRVRTCRPSWPRCGRHEIGDKVTWGILLLFFCVPEGSIGSPAVKAMQLRTLGD